jgi:HSP20 family protein
MSLIRREPFTSMDDMLNRFPNWTGNWPRFSGASHAGPEWSPSVDISETDREFLIRAAVPAVKKDDVEITVEDGMLTLKGERRQQEEHKAEKFHKMESFYGSFARSFVLPGTVDAAAIRAESKDGILTIHVPKKQAEVKKPTMIKVQ